MPSLPETIPTIEELALDRPPCEEIGHPEQMQGRHFAGLYPIHRLLCGDTPDFGAPWVVAPISGTSFQQSGGPSTMTPSR